MASRDLELGLQWQSACVGLIKLLIFFEEETQPPSRFAKEKLRRASLVAVSQDSRKKRGCSGVGIRPKSNSHSFNSNAETCA